MQLKSTLKINVQISEFPQREHTCVISSLTNEQNISSIPEPTLAPCKNIPFQG